MDIDIKKAFDSIKAEQSLKDSTYAFICNEVAKRKKFSYIRRLPAVAICCIIMIVAGFGNKYYYTEAAYVTIDVIPSVELGINSMNRVVSVSTFNEDSSSIADSVKNKTYNEAISDIIKSNEVAKYISDGQEVYITVTSDKSSMENALVSDIKNMSEQFDVPFQCHTVTGEQREAAHHNNMSSGKYMLYLQLYELDPTASPEYCNSLTVNQIQERITECHNAHGVYVENDTEYEYESNNSCRSGHHHNCGHR